MWYDLALNPEIVAHIYKNESPSLQEVSVSGVHLNWDGPTVEITFNVKNFPSEPPEKWVQKGSNMVLITLQLSSVNKVNIQGWDTENVLDISIARSGEKTLRLTGQNRQTTIEVEFEFLYISMSAYQQER